MSVMHVDYVGTDLKAYSECAFFKWMSNSQALQQMHSHTHAHIHIYIHTQTHIYYLESTRFLPSNWMFLTFITPSYLFSYLSAVCSHPSPTLLCDINAKFKCDGMQIFQMEGQLMKHELKLANG